MRFLLLTEAVVNVPNLFERKHDLYCKPPRDELHHKLRTGQNGPRLAQSGPVELGSGLKDKPSTSALSALRRRGE